MYVRRQPPLQHRCLRSVTPAAAVSGQLRCALACPSGLRSSCPTAHTTTVHRIWFVPWSYEEGRNERWHCSTTACPTCRPCHAWTFFSRLAVVTCQPPPSPDTKHEHYDVVLVFPVATNRLYIRIAEFGAEWYSG